MQVLGLKVLGARKGFATLGVLREAMIHALGHRDPFIGMAAMSAAQALEPRALDSDILGAVQKRLIDGDAKIREAAWVALEKHKAV